MSLPFKLEWDEINALWHLDTPPSMQDVKIPGLLFEEYNTGRAIRVFGHEVIKEAVTALQTFLDHSMQDISIPYETGFGHTAHIIDDKVLITGPHLEPLLRLLGIANLKRQGRISEVVVKSEVEARQIEAILLSMSRSPKTGPAEFGWLYRSSSEFISLPGFSTWKGFFLESLKGFPALKSHPLLGLKEASNFDRILVPNWLEPEFRKMIEEAQEQVIAKQRELKLVLDTCGSRLASLEGFAVGLHKNFIMIECPRGNKLTYSGCNKYGFTWGTIYHGLKPNISAYLLPISPSDSLDTIKSNLSGMIAYIEKKYAVGSRKRKAV